jgi:large subunit ribosomal protein L25
MASHTRPRIAAEPRSGSGRKSDLRALRRAGIIPGSVFGHGEPQKIQLSARALADFLRHHAAGGILDLELEGSANPALIREVDRHPVSGEVIHLGLQRVDMTETLRVVIPIHFIGEHDLIERDLVLQRQITEVEVHARADLLPETLEVDVSAAAEGDVIRVADLKLPEGLEVTNDRELPVATITTPSLPADVEAALDAEDAAHAAVHAANAEASEESESREGA